MKTTWSLLLVSILVTGALVAQQPPVSNAKLETAQAQGRLDMAVRAAMGRQAMFWLGQLPDARALRFIEETLAS